MSALDVADHRGSREESRLPGRVLGPLLAVLVALLMGAAPASAAIKINEVESDAPAGGADYIELYNTGPGAVDISNYVVKDSNNNNADTIGAGTTLADGGFFTVDTSFGLGSADSARLYEPGGTTLLDSYSWTGHAYATWGRCPDGSGPIVSTLSGTKGAANSCFPAGTIWPGGTATAEADDPGVFGSNLSGLAYQPSGTSAKGVLWAVRNGPSTLFRLVWNGTKWTPDTANGWSNGKTLVYPNGGGVPDAEGVTLTSEAGAIFVSTERNDDGANSNTSRPAVLKFDTTAAGATLTATRDWNMTATQPGLPANAGLEAVTWVPDSLLVAKGWIDPGTGSLYDPALYPNSGGGIFLVGVENDGSIAAYSLDQTADTFTKLATIASGFPKIMDLSYEPESTHLWAVCDDTCNGQTKVLDIAQSGVDDGKFVVTDTFDRPAGMANLNNEGFTIAPQRECVGGFKPVYWSDDSNTGGHALRSGTLNCTVLPPGVDPTTPAPTTPAPTTPAPVGGGSGTPTPAAPVVVVVVPPAAGPPAPVDVTAPSLKLALTFKASGKFAVRTSGRFGLDLTLGEHADLTISATVKKTASAKTSKVLLKPVKRSGLAAGKSTLTFTLSKSAKKSLKKGYSVTVTVVAKDPSGNTTTTKTTAKVR